MMKCYFKGPQKGFSLLESIISVTLIALAVNGLFMTWQFVETKTAAYDQYAQAKESLETAYEITARTIREAQLTTVQINSAHDGLSFTKSDGSVVLFSKSNNVYQMQQNGETVNLITGCAACNFGMTGNMMTIRLSAASPANWSDASDLSISGNVFPRN